MFAVVVDFVIKPGRMEDFLPLMHLQGKNSLEREPGCRHFDICRDAGAPDTIVLYEIYDDAAAFDHHLASDHYRTFDATVTEMLARKTVRRLELLGGSGAT